jgi:hypothetical protein
MMKKRRILLIVIFLVILFMLAYSVNAGYCEESNPTGNPIGGGAGYSNIVPIPNTGIVTNKAELLSALSSATSGAVIYVDDNALIDLTGETSIGIPGGVILASGRGRGSSEGALLYTNQLATMPLFKALGPDVRITGLRIRGPDPDINMESGSYGTPNSDGIRSTYPNLEVDNNEIWAWSQAGIYIFQESATNAYIHHNNIHHTQRWGLGYGISIHLTEVLIEANFFDHNRHAISATGQPNTGYEARYNVFGENFWHYPVDMHGAASGIAGSFVKVHHNSFYKMSFNGLGQIHIEGVPTEGAEIHNNWFVLDQAEVVSQYYPNIIHDNFDGIDIHDNTYNSAFPNNCVVNPSPDIDGNSVVDIRDILLVVNDFGKTSGFDPKVDLNSDSVINILDTIIITNNWGVTPSDFITVTGDYIEFNNFPTSFFDGSAISPQNVVKILDQAYLLEGVLNNEAYPTVSGPISSPNSLQFAYDPNVYGTNGFPMKLGYSAAPAQNSGDHSWDIMFHEMAHNFWNANQFFYTIAAPGPFLQESTSVLAAEFIYQKFKSNPGAYGISADELDSLTRVFEAERNYQESRYNEYVSNGMPYSQDESGPNNAILTSQAFNYEMFLIGDEFGWDNFVNFNAAFTKIDQNQFAFWQDGVLDIEETTYSIAALNYAFGQDFRQRFRNLNFPIDENYYNQIFPILNNVLNPVPTCEEQLGDICDTTEVCPGTSLTASNTDRCCSQTCVIPSLNLCSECGDGVWNKCDQTECNSIAEGCYFDTTGANSCEVCAGSVCENYDNQGICEEDHCGLGNCKWENSGCVTAVDTAPPTINSFTTNPTRVSPGGPSTLSWSVTGADSLSINQAVGDVTGSTQRIVNPSSTTTYTLTATNTRGSDTKTITVNSDTFPEFKHMEYYGYYLYGDQNVPGTSTKATEDLKDSANLFVFFEEIVRPSLTARLKANGQKMVLYIGSFHPGMGGVGPEILFTDRNARLARLKNLKQKMIDDPNLRDTVAYIAPSDEWYTRLWRGELDDWGVFATTETDQIQRFEQRKPIMKSLLEGVIADIKQVFPNIPTIIIENGWWEDRVPYNVDVLGMDAYFKPSDTSCSNVQKANFDAIVTNGFNTVKSFGKPMLMIGYSAVDPVHDVPAIMLSECHFQWYFDVAQSIQEITGLVWWMYPSDSKFEGVSNPKHTQKLLFLKDLGRTVVSP